MNATEKRIAQLAAGTMFMRKRDRENKAAARWNAMNDSERRALIMKSRAPQTWKNDYIPLVVANLEWTQLSAQQRALLS